MRVIVYDWRSLTRALIRDALIAVVCIGAFCVLWIFAPRWLLPEPLAKWWGVSGRPIEGGYDTLAYDESSSVSTATPGDIAFVVHLIVSRRASPPHLGRIPVPFPMLIKTTVSLSVVPGSTAIMNNRSIAEDLARPALRERFGAEVEPFLDVAVLGKPQTSHRIIPAMVGVLIAMILLLVTALVFTALASWHAQRLNALILRPNRCPECDYPLVSSQSRCPECGTIHLGRKKSSTSANQQSSR